MPRLWEHTIDAHREAVRDSILATTARLVAEQGLAAVTMSEVAEQAGIGRATLYKYFPDLESILRAWHERQIAAHLEHLTHVRDNAPEGERLEAVLTAYGTIAMGSRDHGDPQLAALLHGDDQVHHAERRLHDLVRDLIGAAARCGQVRRDVTADELARYAVSALSAARDARSRAAVQRLVALTLAGLRPPTP